MLELERRIHDALPPAKQRRFHWLAAHRLYVARVIAECLCWGLADVPSLDRQLGLVEQGICNLISNEDDAVELRALYVVHDSQLIHGRGEPPDDFDCAVCRSGGHFGIEDMLARLPHELD